MWIRLPDAWPPTEHDETIGEKSAMVWLFDETDPQRGVFPGIFVAFYDTQALPSHEWMDTADRLVRPSHWRSRTPTEARPEPPVG